jgi:hypothetical protein
MKIRITDEGLAQFYGLNTTDAYTVVRPADDETVNRLWGPHPDAPYKDADGDYWIDARSGGVFDVAAVHATRAEVVE